MPQRPSSKKRLRQSIRRRVRNLGRMKQMKVAVRAFTDAVAVGNAEEIKQAFIQAQKSIDKAEKRGILNANTASRRVARLDKIRKSVEA